MVENIYQNLDCPNLSDSPIEAAKRMVAQIYCRVPDNIAYLPLSQHPDKNLK